MHRTSWAALPSLRLLGLAAWPWYLRSKKRCWQWCSKVCSKQMIDPPLKKRQTYLIASVPRKKDQDGYGQEDFWISIVCSEFGTLIFVDYPLPRSKHWWLLLPIPTVSIVKVALHCAPQWQQVACEFGVSGFQRVSLRKIVEH